MARIGTNAFATGLSAAHSPIANSELTLKRADDSIRVMVIDLYNPPIPAGVPVAARMFLRHKTSWTIIMKVRRRLSESVIEKYAMIVSPSIARQIAKVPVAISSTSTWSVTSVYRELKYVPTDPRYMKRRKAMTQRFLE